MLHRVSRTMIVAVVAAAAAFADDPKCTASARDCDQQIRHMLSGRRYFGAKVDETKEGLVIKVVLPDSPAERGGLKPGDRLIAINGKPLTRASQKEYKQVLAEARGTGRLRIIIWRGRSYQKVDTQLQPYTKEQIDKIISAHLAQSHPTTAAGAQ